MRVSIVTTTLNAMPFIAETTRSVLQTNYRDLEYIIIDAGSSDGTLEYIRSLHDSRVKSELIKGIKPYEAVDLGFRKATGDVLAWINGDDIYYPWTISLVAKLFQEFSGVQWMIGLPSFLDVHGHCTGIGALTSYPKRYIENGWFKPSAFGCLQQESMFWRRSLYESAGRLNLEFQLAADFDLWVRMASHAPLVPVCAPLAAFRRHGTNRSITSRKIYLQNVEDATKSLPRLGMLKRGLCQAHVVTKHALRLAEWHRTNFIGYSLSHSRWKLGSVVRPISRDTLQQLAMEFRLRPDRNSLHITHDDQDRLQAQGREPVQ